MPRRLTKQLDGSISMDDGVGTQVHFEGDAEFNALYPSLDLTGKTRLVYELGRPDWAFHQDPALAINDNRANPTQQDIDDMKVQAYEDAIDAAAALFAAQQDPYKGLDLAACKLMKKEDLLSEGKAHFEAAWDIFSKQVKRLLSGMKTITVVQLSNPCQLTFEENHNWFDNWSIFIPQIEGTVELQGFVGKITVIDNKNVTLNNCDATGFTAYTSNGYAQGELNLLQMKVDYEKVEDHYQAKCAEVDACSTVAEVKAVTANWPTI